MNDYKTVAVSESGGVITFALRRPEVHNAFNDELIAEGIDFFQNVGETYPGGRAVILRGEGTTFCAGADLNWMSRMVSYTREENIRDSSLLAKFYALINECPLPVIGRVEGAAIGGGVGLVAVCDIAFATASTKFALAEVKLGILPAVISPYVIAKIGESHARALFLTGERFAAERALQIGLVHGVAEDASALDKLVEASVAQLLSSGPSAVKACKKLIAHVVSHELADSIPYTIDAIATQRVSEEGQAGMNAFLKKEKAPWVNR